MVIAQIEGEFKVCGFEVHFTKVTINHHVAGGMIGMKPPPQGIVGSIFDLLVLAVESCMQINQVNCIVLEQQGIICVINKCCGIVGLKLSLFLQVMRVTNVSLNVMVAQLIKERCVQWTTYNNLLKWFIGYWAFMLKYEFVQPGSNGDEMIVKEENLHWILNINEMKMSLDGSKTRAGGRSAVTFFDLHLPMPCVSTAKSSLSCTGIFGSSAAGECVPPHWQIPTTAMAVEREKVWVDFIQHFMKT
jgi:hypothetical protein